MLEHLKDFTLYLKNKFGDSPSTAQLIQCARYHILKGAIENSTKLVVKGNLRVVKSFCDVKKVIKSASYLARALKPRDSDEDIPSLLSC